VLYFSRAEEVITFPEAKSSAFEQNLQSASRHVDPLSRSWELRETFSGSRLPQLRESRRLKEETEPGTVDSVIRFFLVVFVSGKMSLRPNRK